MIHSNVNERYKRHYVKQDTITAQFYLQLCIFKFNFKNAFRLVSASDPIPFQGHCRITAQLCTPAASQMIVKIQDLKNSEAMHLYTIISSENHSHFGAQPMNPLGYSSSLQRDWHRTLHPSVEQAVAKLGAQGIPDKSGKTIQINKQQREEQNTQLVYSYSDKTAVRQKLWHIHEGRQRMLGDILADTCTQITQDNTSQILHYIYTTCNLAFCFHC